MKKQSERDDDHQLQYYGNIGKPQYQHINDEDRGQIVIQPKFTQTNQRKRYSRHTYICFIFFVMVVYAAYVIVTDSQIKYHYQQSTVKDQDLTTKKEQSTQIVPQISDDKIIEIDLNPNQQISPFKDIFSQHVQTPYSIITSKEEHVMVGGDGQQQKQEKHEDFANSIKQRNDLFKFQKIIWVQTEDELASQTMIPTISAQNIIHFSKQSGYEVRIVDNLNAYDWLSPQMVEFVRATHHRSRVDLPVYELLRLALLIEHGGVSIKLPNIILLENIGWIEEIFRNQGSDTLCKVENAEVFMFQTANGKGILEYKEDIIVAAVKQSKLLVQIMDEMSKIVTDGKWPYQSPNITKINKDTEVISFPLIIQTLFNIKHKKTQQNICAEYKLQSIEFNKGPYSSIIQQKNQSTLLKNIQEFQSIFGKKYLLKVTMKHLIPNISKIIRTGNTQFDKNSLLFHKIMMTEGSQWLTRPTNKSRNVHFCIISLKQQQIVQMQQQNFQQIQKLQKQTFKNWNLVHFVKNYTSVFSEVGLNPNLTLVNGSEYEGLNLQRAAVKYCNPESIGLLMDYDEYLQDSNALQNIAKEFSDKQVFGAFINLQTPGQIIKSSMKGRQIRRKTNKPNKNILNEISNLFRVFTIQSYRFIAHFDLYHSSGRYFNRQIPFLSMLEIAWDFKNCTQGSAVYQVRRLQQFMDIPIKRLHLDVVMTAKDVREVNLQLYQYKGKLRYRQMCETILFYEEYVTPIETMAVFNDGYEFLGVSNQVNGIEESKLIPKKIHQIWVSGQIPKFKQILMNKLKELHPDYEYYFWSEKNITRQNFPITFDIITTLLQFDKKSPYNKMATISDLMRLQIVYLNGGFYVDTNYMIFKKNTFDLWRKYQFVTAGELSQRQRMFRDNALFAAVKGYDKLLRVVNHKALSNRNVYSKRATKETGPAYLGKVVLGKDQLDPKVFQPGFEQFYPNFLYDPGNPNINQCVATRQTPQSDILFRGTRSYVKYCEKIYPYAYGLDFFSQGLTWKKRRW